MSALTFNDLQQLTDREIQVLLREVDQKDLVVALKSTPQALTEKITGNMSKRVRTFILEEVDFLGPMPPNEIEDVQQRIAQQAAQSIDQGHITWPPKKKKAAKANAAPKPTKLSKSYLAMKRQAKKTAHKPLDQLSHDEMNTLFGQLAEIARREGILALEDMVPAESSAFLPSGVLLAVDGTEPALIMDILQTWMESLIHQQKRKYQKVIEGIMAIQAGDNPRVVEHKLSVMY